MTVQEALNIADSGDRTLDDPLVVLADHVRALEAELLIHREADVEIKALLAKFHDK